MAHVKNTPASSNSRNLVCVFMVVPKILDLNLPLVFILFCALFVCVFVY